MEENTEIRLLRELAEREAWSSLPEQYELLHVQDIAHALNDLPIPSLARAFQELPNERRSDVFSHLDMDVQYALLQEMDDDDGRVILQNLLPDDRTALLASLSSENADQLLRLLAPDQVKQVLAQLGYPEYSAGRLMTTEFVALRPEWTLEHALQFMRSRGADEETVNTLYVTDAKGHLLGTIGFKRLVLGAPNLTVEEAMSGPPVSVHASDDREEAARLVQHYDINALPVVNRHGMLLGVVTVDDVIDVIEEEVTEDFHKIGGTGALGLSLRDARPSLLYRKRAGWLVLLVFMNIFGGAAIAYYEETIEAVIALVFFLPLIVDSGGNAGSQAATLMVRALATGDVHARDWLRLWGKELAVAAALGITMGAAVWGLGLWRGGPEVATVVASSMVLVVIVGSMIGMLLPFLLTRLKFDPATASAPLITSIADICGILIYFSVATAVLTVPAAV